MGSHKFSTDNDQHDPKLFKESLGSFGTTTQPGQNQLTELQTKIRQGVKHVELHLGGRGKGNFGVQDVPDKYGFEQRRTIMQLAKLNQQTLSVHGTFDVVSFSGINQGGFDDADRLNSIKEIDETIKFAAETAKSGAVVFHIQGDPISNDRSELNLSRKYLNWLKKNKPEEYTKVKNEYFDANNLNRKFVSNPEKEKDIREEFEKLKQTNNDKYNKYLNQAKNSNENRKPWEYYYMDLDVQKRKLSPDRSPMVLLGDKMSGVERQQEFIDLKLLSSKKNFNSNEKEILKKLNISIGDLNIEDYQKTQAIFTNGLPTDLEGKVNIDDYKNLKNKLLINYDKVFANENNSLSHADETFMKKFIDHQIDLVALQKEDLETNKLINEDSINKIEDLQKKERDIATKIRKAKSLGDLEKIKDLRAELNGGLNQKDQLEMNSIYEKYQKTGQITKLEQEKFEKFQQKSGGIQRQKAELMNSIGQVEYQKLEKYNEMTSQLNEQKQKLEEQKGNISAVTDVIFDKNTSAIGHLGIKALRYQLDLKKKSHIAKDKLNEFNIELTKLEDKYENAKSNDEKFKLADQINRVKYRRKDWIGVSDYEDIDLINNPLYLAPENMLPGMGSMTSLEEFKGAIRMSQEEFASKILSNESEYKKLKEEYEKETGKKINNHEDAIELAKRHIGGTFDNAHAAVWLKHFKKEDGESEEHRIDRFNNWLNTEAEGMVRDGIVKHIHFNDTQAKDDDHNLLGSGILDLHDLRHRLRKAGLKEALIVEAGGRGAHSVMHLANAFEIFNPSISKPGYNLNSLGSVSSGVSDWIEVQRGYNQRPQYSTYGMGYSGFKHQPPQNPNQRGGWSGTGFM